MRVQFLWQPRNSKNCRQLPDSVSVSVSDWGWVRNLRAQKIIKKTKNHNKVEHITRCRSCRGYDTCFVCRNRTKLKTNRKLKTEKENMKTKNYKWIFSGKPFALGVCLFYFGSAALAAGGPGDEDDGSGRESAWPKFRQRLKALA